MKKHPRITSAIQKGNCSFMLQILPHNQQVAPNAFSRYISKASYKHSPSKGIKVYQLPCGCFVWCYSSGIRELSAFPF